MNESIYIAALDIGTTKICCMVARRNEFGKIDIIAVGKADSHGVIRGEVQNINLTAEAIEKAVHEAESQCGFKITDVHVGIAGSHIRSFQHRGQFLRDTPDVITSEDVRKLIQSMYRLRIDPGDRIIHVLPQDYIVDNEHGILHPVGVIGTRLEANFHIITGKQHAATCIDRAVKKAGLNVADIILEPIASSASVLGDDEKEAGVALIDIGGGTSDVAVFKDGIIQHTFVIGMGGNSITEDIKQGLMITKDHAEKLKVKHGNAISVPSQETEFVIINGIRGREAKEISKFNLAKIIQARVEEIVDYVDNELRRNDLKRNLVAGIVITGGGAELKHLRQLVELRTGLDARVGRPTEHLGASPMDMVNHPMYATAVGLLIQGFEEYDSKNPSATERVHIKNEMEEVSARKVESTIHETPIVANPFTELPKNDANSTQKSSIWKKWTHWWNDQSQDDFEN